MTTTSNNTALYKFIAIVALAACAFFWYKSCHPSTPSPVITQNKTATDSIAKITAKADSFKMRVGFLMEDTTRYLKAYRLQSDSFHAAKKLILAANQQVSVLANEVADAHTAKDTAKFIASCDSLARAVKLSEGKFTAYKEQADRTLNKALIMSKKKSDIITQLNAEATGYKGAGELLKKQNATLAAAINPTRKVYAGIEAWTCPVASGVGVGAMYADLRERQYGLSGGVATTGGIWIGGKVYFKIQLHR